MAWHCWRGMVLSGGLGDVALGGDWFGKAGTARIGPVRRDKAR